MSTSPTRDLAGRTFFVTGTSSGIGKTTVDALVTRGASVVVGNRSEEKTRPILDELRARHPGADVTFVRLDLGDLKQVKRAAEDFLATGRKLDVLINNAGIAAGKGVTKDGFEITLGTNHIGPFLLTQTLLPLLREAPQGRVVNVSSEAHFRVRAIRWEALREPSHSARQRLLLYGVSKLMNVLHARELARRESGTRVTTYSLHPGVVATDVWREGPKIVTTIAKLFMISEEKGALTTLCCATAPELAKVSGRYYEKCKEKRVNKLADDTALARELWERSEKAIALVV